MIAAARISLSVFIQSCILCASAFFTIDDSFIAPIAISVIFANIYFFVAFADIEYQIAVRSGNIAIAFTTGVFLHSTMYAISSFGLYLACLSFFHFSEFFVLSITNPADVNLSAFLLDHSREYKIAMVASWLEYLIEIYYFPWLKTSIVCRSVGFVFVIVGELIRKSAMVTAGQSFTHLIQNSKRPEHILITSGIYSIFRHPSYVGWFYWSIATQLLLVNPICFLAYSLASWRFFNDRIYVEEQSLLYFFGNEYVLYQDQVDTGLPFIQGYVLRAHSD